MGEVLCVASWDNKKEKKLAQWANASPERYVLWAVEEEITPHPRMYKIDDNDLTLRQLALDPLYLPFVYEDSSHPTLQKLTAIQTELHLRASDFLDQGVRLLSNYRANLQRPFRLAEECFGKLHPFSAVVCGAGPSLQQAISSLKKYEDQILIIGCGAGMQALIAAGIKPHLAVHVDPSPSHQFSKIDVPLFFQLRTSFEVTKQARSNCFLMAGSGNFPIEHWIEEKIGIESSLDGGWTATTQGVALATALGCKSIYLAGVDFKASSNCTYAKGVDPQESLIKVALKDGTKIETRPDWILAADWINAWVLSHPKHQWGILSEPNFLLPNIPKVDLNIHIGKNGVSLYIKELFAKGLLKDGKQIWQEVENDFKHCKLTVDQFLARFQSIFPTSPLEDEECLGLLQDLSQRLVVQQILDPIWSYWEFVLKRQTEGDQNALMVHRILLLKSLVDQFYA